MPASIHHEGDTHLIGQAGLAMIHHECDLVTLLWKTIQEDLVDFLRFQSKSVWVTEHIFNHTRFLDLLEKEITTEQGAGTRVHVSKPGRTRSAAEEYRRPGPERPRVPLDPRVVELLRLPPDPQRRKKERKHFLGRGNPRRPSKN